MTSAARRLLCARHIVFLCAVAALFLASVQTAFAGFGITPPYVSNSRLTRGTVYEQQITLVRSDPTEDLKAEVTMNIPGVEDWFSIDKGMEFILPTGQRQVPITIRVAVPEDAEYKPYKGAIRLRTSSTNSGAQGGVSIALGAQIDVNIEVVDKIEDFNVRRVRMTDLEEGRRKWGLFFPAKIRFFMTVENTGNTDFGPTKVTFDIYDSDQEVLLESVTNTNKIDKIAPFAIKEVVAELPTRLPAGRYTAKYTIYKNGEIAQQNLVNVSVAAIGSVPGYEGYGFGGLSISDKLKVAGALLVPILLIVTLVALLIMRRRRRRRMQIALHAIPPSIP